MPFKDVKLRREAVLKSRAKKPELYKALDKKKSRASCARGYHIQRRYGISPEEALALLESQDNKCAICFKLSGNSITGRTNLHVDHNHATGQVRGFLCARCNLLVGIWEQPNGPETIQRMKEYVEKNS